MGVEPKSFEPLRNLTSLETLNLNYTSINDLSPLTPLVNLRDLELANNTRITDISSLKHLQRLERLILGRKNVTDFTPLTELKNLKPLDMEGTPVTAGDKQMLRDALPKCEIIF